MRPNGQQPCCFCGTLGCSAAIVVSSGFTGSEESLSLSWLRGILSTAAEYEEYAAACDLATGTRWPAHFAQRCSDRYFYHVRNLVIPMQDKNRTTDLVVPFRIFRAVCG